MTPEEFAGLVRQCWSADTAGWEWDNPAKGQCAVTSLLAQEHFGGRIIHGLVGNIQHYWNEMAPDGPVEWVDFTAEQFPEDTEPEFLRYVSREELLGDEDRITRYLILAGRFQELTRP